MLSIRPDQRDAIRNELNTAFVEKLDAFLLKEVPEHADIPREERLPLIDALLTIAAGYGLEIEQHATVYVLTAWLCGFDFDDQHPQVKARLSSEDYTPEEKTQWLTEWMESQAQPD
jgi:hypothetical protein